VLEALFAADRPVSAEQIARRRFGYEARFTHFAIVGRCPGCFADASNLLV
jgi:hypothetical protein